MKKKYILILSSVLIFSLFSLNISVFYEVKASASATNLPVSKNQPKIIIDAGHGGEDGGATGVNGILEKDINLKICLTLEKFLIQSGYNTVMIRTADTSVHNDNASTIKERKVSDIKNRVKISNSDENNILISIHQNHFSESKYNGTQVFYSKNNANSLKLAECIRASVTSLLQPQNTRQCKESYGVYLLDNTNVPAVIVECGFLSNPEEADMLGEEEYRNNIAYCIYLGLLEYIYLNY